jgi:hypothetical protein
MPENEDQWRTLHLPLNLWERLHVQFARILRANNTPPGALTGEDKKARTAARVDATEFLVLLCERTENEEVFRV